MPRLPSSLAGRVLLASLVLLPLFLGASGLYLERSHRLSIEAAEAERLQLQVFTLLAQAEYDTALQLPRELIAARLTQPNSGLYARVYDRQRQLLWQSPSTVFPGLPAGEPPPPALAPGERRFSRSGGLFRMAYQVLWETRDGRQVPLLFEVMETTAAVDADLALYRRHLWFWLGGSAVLLVLCQVAIAAWGLRPLRQLARDIAAVETGDADRLTGHYPGEVQAVTDNLNTLLRSEQERRERARRTLGDLAHSLKTPLAVIASADENAPDFPRLVREQAAGMEETISYQLQRGIGGAHLLLRTVRVAPVASRLSSTLAKVHAGRGVDIKVAIDGDIRFRGDERDLLEMLGNLMDNACKHGAGRVVIRARSEGGTLYLSVHDNGPGVDPDQRQRVLQRGARGDSRGPGHGIGLAVTHDICASYGGTLALDDSPLGGARATLALPE